MLSGNDSTFYVFMHIVAKPCLVVQVNVQAPHHKMLQVDEVGGEGVACLGHDATEGPQCCCAHFDRFVRKRNPKAKIIRNQGKK